MRKEYDFLFALTGRVPSPIPVLETTDIRTGSPTHPGGFLMPRYHIARVASEDEVAKLAAHIFWDLGLLHMRGIVHKDVKPSNFLCCFDDDDSKRRYFLGDYGAAENWVPTDRMSASATEAYASVPGTFEGTDTSMYERDHESLYWSVFALWLQVAKQREVPGKFRVDRQTDIAVLRATGGSYFGESATPVLRKPGHPSLERFLVDQAESQRLHIPTTVFQEIYSEGMSVEDFNESAREKGKLPCLPEIFEVLVAANKERHT